MDELRGIQFSDILRRQEISLEGGRKVNFFLARAREKKILPGVELTKSTKLILTFFLEKKEKKRKKEERGKKITQPRR